MKILYGIQGTGNGHITRARVMANCFNEMGVGVDYLFSGRNQKDYFDMQEFGDYRCFRGLSFCTENGQIKGYKTLRNARVCQLLKDIKSLDLTQYDLVINDFEPLSAWAAKQQNIPVIGISHQAAFLSNNVPLFGSGFFRKSLIKQYAPADKYLGVHWQPFDKTIIPPFIAHHEHVNPVPVYNKILVYLPFENLANIIAYLKDFPEKEFYCYYPGARNRSHGHIHIRPPSRNGFLNDLANASGVIGNAGFELASEALKLGKKLLLKPLGGQFEQGANAKTLLAMKAAHVMNYLNPQALDEWNNAPQNKPINFPNNPEPLVQWLLKKQWHETCSLHNNLWKNVSLK
ncbi:glycosyltransferase [Pseudoalteromonas sp. MMG010]|uniref:MJ1255/VC2487 family glycosyltransferase n=1 Tax=Pseudoalteromonas sp. MMG010 TaxID=2822685 RepID=UPI001B3A6F2F|nr:MJ1255/VC2487 family glycosyltransferase [Pseudoalteromonas sp. MMG010]MBQ4832613.1 glycosyltransferase [Pseudoalteromonas sp. MMG010]